VPHRAGTALMTAPLAAGSFNRVIAMTGAAPGCPGFGQPVASGECRELTVDSRDMRTEARHFTNAALDHRRTGRPSRVLNEPETVVARIAKAPRN